MSESTFNNVLAVLVYGIVVMIILGCHNPFVPNSVKERIKSIKDNDSTTTNVVLSIDKHYGIDVFLTWSFVIATVSGVACFLSEFDTFMKCFDNNEVGRVLMMVVVIFLLMLAIVAMSVLIGKIAEIYAVRIIMEYYRKHSRVEIPDSLLSDYLEKTC